MNYRVHHEVQSGIESCIHVDLVSPSCFRILATASEISVEPYDRLLT